MWLCTGARVGLKSPSDSWASHCMVSDAVEFLPFQHMCDTDAPRVGNSRYLQDSHLLLVPRGIISSTSQLSFSTLRNGCHSTRKALDAPIRSKILSYSAVVLPTDIGLRRISRRN
jgi:hypothetical protein